MRRWTDNKFYRWRRPSWLAGPSAPKAPRGRRAPTDGAPRSQQRPSEQFLLNYPRTTLGRLIDQAAERFGPNCAVIYGDTHWTYDHLLRAVNRLAAGLSGHGVGHGDRVLLTLPNCPEYITAFLAVQKLGAVVVNAGPLMGVDDLQQLRAMTQPKLVFALDLQAPRLAPLREASADMHCVWVSLKDYQTVWKRLGYRAKLWQTHGHDESNGRARVLPDLMNEAPSRPPSIAPDPHDTAVLQPTGGTTGILKVAQLSHANLLANAMQISIWANQSAGQDRVLALLPMFHVYGLTTCLVTPLFNAATILPVTRFNVSQLLSLVREHRPTVLPLAPAVIEPMCEHMEQRPKTGIEDALRGTIVTSGAAPLPARTAQRFEKLTGVRIAQGYGLTEASPATHLNPLRSPRHDSIGLPLTDTLTRVADLNDPKRDAAPGEPGELLVGGPQIMKGYLNNSEETGLVISQDEHGRRWLHTGDVVRVDADGYTYVIDRRKDMINCGGLKVYPGKVERVLMTHDQVRDAAVVSRPDTVKTDRVVAVIVQRDPAMPADQLTKTLRALCREHLAPYEVPRAFQFVEELPRNALGKLQKFRLQSDDGGPDGNDVEEAVESGDASEKRRTPMRTESVHERHGKHEESSPVN